MSGKKMRNIKDVEIQGRPLTEILENHRHWLLRDCEGWKAMRADLSYAKLSEVDLSRLDLQEADLSCAEIISADLTAINLSGADLKGVDFAHSNLEAADLYGTCSDLASFYGANLSHSNLEYASLRECDFNGADLHYADLYCADLYEAKLIGANLTETVMSCANLCSAYLRESDVRHANFSNAKLQGVRISKININEASNFPYIPMACPDTGSFIGWKKAADGVIVKLLIPEDAKRSSGAGRKCRCDKAFVLDIEGTIHKVAFSMYNPNFIYRKGKMVEVKNFCTDRFEECAPGIHFFINREEALQYL